MISVCVICRNEEKNIERCLSSIKNIADEIIIVDTGSKDSTINIAKKFTDKIFNFKWGDDFSEARNFAIKNAEKEWILFIDADESISQKDGEKIKELTKKDDFLGFGLIQRNYTNNLGEYGVVSTINDSYDESRNFYGYVPRRIIRLFKKDSRIKFEGEVHENVGNSILRIGKNKKQNTDIVIHHFGSINADKEKTRRYIEIEKKSIRDNFLDYCKIGVQLHSINENEEAEEYLKKSIEKNPSFAYPYTELGVIMIEKNDIEQAKKLLQKAESLQKNPMTFNYLGIVHGKNKEYAKSIEYFKKAIEMIPINADFHYNLGFAYLNAGKKEDAVREMKIAVTLNPAYKSKVKFEN
jgi:glycosyltransferase involved in cell wall biosynthesis